MSTEAALHARLQRWQRISWITGGAGLFVWLLCAFFATPSAFQAYWFAWVFWAGLGFGSLALLLLRFLARGAWGDAVQRPAEAGIMTLPVMALLLVPVFFGMPHIFPWARPDAFAGHDWPHKRAYLQVGWFVLRAFCYFAVLLPIAWLLRVWSTAAHEPTAEAGRLLPAVRGLSGFGAVAYFFCMEFASTDWVLSLEPEWYSSMFVVILASGQFLSALAFGIVFVTFLGRDEPLSSLLTPKHLHDLGNLLLAFVIFWAYVSFSQFLLIWMGNLPREISWYLHRRTGGWPYIALFLALFQFAVPFALLLSRAAKRHRQRLGPIAALVLLANVVNVYWLVTPSFQHESLHLPWLELVAFVAIGGIWTAVFLLFVRRRPLIPLHTGMEVHRG